MNRRELVTAIAAHSGAEPKVVDSVLRGFTDVVLATVANGDPVVLTGVAKFAKVHRKARMGRNPATGEAIKIKASKKGRITALKTFKDVTLGAAPAPNLTKSGPIKATKAAPARATRGDDDHSSGEVDDDPGREGDDHSGGEGNAGEGLGPED